MLRRDVFKATAAVAAGSTLSGPALSQGAAARTLRVIPQANLTSLDPIWTTAVVTRNHGFLIYDQPCAQDANGEIRPQMAEGWDVAQDGLTWTDPAGRTHRIDDPHDWLGNRAGTGRAPPKGFPRANRFGDNS